MAYELFIERFHELAWKETRSVSLSAGNQFGLPKDDYGFMELYCTDENCDCRRVMFDVLSRRRKKSVAVISFGWESAPFYQKWYGGVDSPEMRMAVNEMTGINMNSSSPQSKIAPAVLELVRWVLQDLSYVDRIKRHYKMFKETVDGHSIRMPDPGEIPVIPELPINPIENVKTNFKVLKSRKRHRSR